MTDLATCIVFIDGTRRLIPDDQSRHLAFVTDREDGSAYSSLARRRCAGARLGASCTSDGYSSRSDDGQERRAASLTRLLGGCQREHR